MAELVTKAELSAAMAGLEAAIEKQARQLTFRWGIMLAAGFGGLAAFLKLT